MKEFLTARQAAELLGAPLQIIVRVGGPRPTTSHAQRAAQTVLHNTRLINVRYNLEVVT